MLGAVLVVGARINGARRWFHVGGVSFQPAELAKLALVIYLAYSLAKKAEKVRSFTVGFVPHMIVCGLMMGLLLKQPDLGTAVILGMTTLLLLFVAGAKISYIFIAFLAAAPVMYQAIVGTPWRLRRMLAFLDPWQYRYDVGYQITESLISIGSGGVGGLGLGDGKQKLFFLPEAHTDYVMAIVGEELGLFGICAVAALFVRAGLARRARGACGRATPSAAISASASPRCSGCRRWSTSASCSARCRPRACRCRSSASAARRSSSTCSPWASCSTSRARRRSRRRARAKGPWLPRIRWRAKKGNRKLPGGGRASSRDGDGASTRRGVHERHEGDHRRRRHRRAPVPRDRRRRGAASRAATRCASSAPRAASRRAPCPKAGYPLDLIDVAGIKGQGFTAARRGPVARAARDAAVARAS